MKILTASPDHCRAVAEAHVESWQAAYAGILPAAFLCELSVDRREASWRQVLSEQKSELLIACTGTQVVGFSSFGPARDADSPSNGGELWALYVRPAAWSTGAGRELWRATKARLQSRGLMPVSLWVLVDNARALRFYSAAGFLPEPGTEREFELGGAKVREMRMVHAS